MASQPQTKLGIIATRVFWMMLGPLVLAVLAFNIVTTGTSWLTAADFAFFVVLGALILSRWLEFQGGNPETASGEPATRAHLRRYVTGAVLIGLSVWVVANILGNHILIR